MEGEVTSDVENYKVSTSSTFPKKSRPRRLFKSLSFKSSSLLSRRTKSSPQVDKDCSRDCNVQSSGKPSIETDFAMAGTRRIERNQ